MASPQLQNIMKRYGVTSMRDLRKAVADEYTEWFLDPSEEPFRPSDMDSTIDEMLESEYQRIEGGAYEADEEELAQAASFGTVPDDE